jgi:hypothetical protein
LNGSRGIVFSPNGALAYNAADIVAGVYVIRTATNKLEGYLHVPLRTTSGSLSMLAIGRSGRTLLAMESDIFGSNQVLDLITLPDKD